MRLARDRPSEQRLAGARRTEQQHSMRHPTAEALVPVRRLQEVDDLGQLVLGLVDPGHVVERDADPLGIDPPRLRAPEATQPAESPAGRRRDE